MSLDPIMRGLLIAATAQVLANENNTGTISTQDVGQAKTMANNWDDEDMACLAPDIAALTPLAAEIRAAVLAEERARCAAMIELAEARIEEERLERAWRTRPDYGSDSDCDSDEHQAWRRAERQRIRVCRLAAAAIGDPGWRGHVYVPDPPTDEAPYTPPAPATSEVGL